jgi:acetyl/propionyl-CoA carboxylase alpha subunit
VQRAGKDLTIVTYCKGLELSMKAADELIQRRHRSRVVDLRTLRPLDMEPVLNRSRKRIARSLLKKVGSRTALAEIVSRIYEEAFDYVDAPIIRVAQKEVPLPYNRTLEQAAFRTGGRHHRRGKGGLEIMAETISMPKLGFDMAEGLLVRWVKQVGENINKGDVLAEIETDKATVEVESPASGVVLQLIVDQGDGSCQCADCGGGCCW